MYQLAPIKINRDGYIFIAAFALFNLLMYAWATPLGNISLVLTAWCVYFFRDPDRVIPQEKGLVLSPADGCVHQVVPNQAPPEELSLQGDDWTRVSIFLNIFNVHVNRVPTAGKITKAVYRPGKFLNASLDKASQDNERQALALETPEGKIIAFTQIAGLIARRIRCDIRENDKVEAGQRFGLIRFGSRCDVFLPKGITPLVLPGQKVIGGETLLAKLEGTQAKPLAKGQIK